MKSENDISPLPATKQVGEDVLEQLREARSEATQALLKAEGAERKARDLRKAASWKIRQYERMVAEYNGQLRLPVD